MRIAHFAPWAPHRCGLYETVRDLILAERALGHEAELIDVGVAGEGKHLGAEDVRPTGAVKAMPGTWAARNADLFVVSGGIEERFVARTRQPLVHLLHGRPRSSFLGSLGEQPGPYDLIRARMARPRWKSAITLWPEHVPYWELILRPGAVRTTSAPPVDLRAFTPQGPRHEFQGRGPHVLLADVWRDDYEGPYEILHALAALPRAVPFTIHIYAAKSPLRAWDYVFQALRDQGRLGEVKGHMLDIDQVFRGADLVIAAHGIATRLVRESLACGTPVAAVHGCQGAMFEYLPTRASMIVEFEEALRQVVVPARLATLRACARQRAAEFDSLKVAAELLDLYEEVLDAQTTVGSRSATHDATPNASQERDSAREEQRHATIVA